VIEGPNVIEARLVTDAPYIDVHADGVYLLRKLQAVAEWVLACRHLCRI
jgi:hypothetical protein